MAECKSKKLLYIIAKQIDESIETLLVAIKSTSDELFLKELNNQMCEYKNLQKFTRMLAKKNRINLKKTARKTSTFECVRDTAIYIYLNLCESVPECIKALCDYDDCEESIYTILENLYCLQESNIMEIKKFFCKDFELPECN